ncbi:MULTISPECIES: hypothetical protein [unclassified Cupriavidus]|uniref:hypothetical protein n=1 Tax=unclassified Cupriavidus TaxID=2640874 RepID=UPI00313F3BC8
MSVPDQPTIFIYTGNGVTTTFPYGCYILLTEDLVVAIDGVAQTSGFTVNGVGSPTGGAVTFSAPPANGALVQIYREVAIERQTDYQRNGDLRSETLNRDLDRIWMALQDNRRDKLSALRYPIAENLNGILPIAGERKGMLLGFNTSNGRHLMVPFPTSIGAGDMRVDEFRAGGDFVPGTTNMLTLSRQPGTPDNLEVFFDTAFQGPDTWNVVGAQLTFDDPIPVGINTVWARIGTTLSIMTPSPDSVGDDELAWGDSLFKVVNTRADLKSLDTTRYKRAYVLGYAVAGDRGALGPVVFSSASTVPDNGGSVTQPNVGSGRWHVIHPDELNPFMFGAKGDRTITDDTDAIQRCYDACPVGGTMRLPVAPDGGYLISARPGGYCLNFSRQVSIIGEGMFSALNPVAGTTVHTILLKPTPNAGVYDGMRWENFAVGNPYNGQRYGLNGIYIDTTVAGSQLPKPRFYGLQIYPSVNTGGWGILHQNTTANNPNGGMYGAEIDSCRGIGGGIALLESGDSITVKRCILYGPNIGVYASLVNGGGGPASLLTVEDCNITTTNGAFKCDSGNSVKFLRNNCEQIVPFQNGGLYMIDLAGGNGTMWRPEIRGCHLGIFTGVANAGIVRFNNCQGGILDDCVGLNANAGAVGAVITNSNDIQIGTMDWGSSITAKVVDSGGGTMGVIKAPTLVGGWLNVSGQEAQFAKDLSGNVYMSGAVTAGSGGICTLPAGFRPSQPVRFAVYSNNGGHIVGLVSVDTSGNVIMLSGGSVVFSLDGIRFPASNLSSTTV